MVYLMHIESLHYGGTIVRCCANIVTINLTIQVHDTEIELKTPVNS